MDRTLFSSRRFAALLATALTMAAPAASQTSDPIAHGYMRLYAGEPEEATAHFTALRAQQGEALGPWFGSLFSTMARLDYEEALAPSFERSLDDFIERANTRYGRSTQDSEALFYLSQALMLRSTYRLNYDKGMWGAARDAARAKGLADDYIKRHPEHGDAYLTLGLYNYYVDIAPSFVKVLRILLFLPSGNRAEGLRQLERASRTGNLFAPFADTALADINATFENRPAEAITIAARFVQRFPGNAEMRLELAGMHMHPVIEDFARAEADYEAVLAVATSPKPRHVSQRHSAILGLASLRRAQWRLDEALALLNDALRQPPATPAWVQPTLLLRRANYKMLVDDHSATADAQRVLETTGMKRWHEAAQQLVRAQDARRRTNEGPVYTALIPGNRLVVEEKFDEARAHYDRIAAAHPNDWQVRYRLAFLEVKRGRYDAAAAGMRPIVTASAPMPDWVKAAAMLHLAYTHDLAGRRDEAVALYRRVVDKYEREGSAAAARIGLVSPYRGRP